MQTLYLALFITTFTALLVIAAIRLPRSEFSLFELEHRSGTGDKNARRVFSREKLIGNVISLQRIFIAILLVDTSIFGILAFGWLIGIVISLVVALTYESIARLNFIKFLSRKINDRTERAIFKFVRKHRIIVKLFRGASTVDNQNRLQLGSREELQHLIAESGSVFSDDDKSLITNSLTFNNQLIKSIMIPRDKINSIDRNEFLGPLALNDLHKIGHSRLPVIKGDLNRIIGILNLKNLLTLDTKRSTTAEKAMEPKAYYIREDQTLYQGLVAFSHTHQHLMVVINEAKETVGIVVLKDIIEALLGRKIVDEFDDYDDPRAVATQKIINH